MKLPELKKRFQNKYVVRIIAGVLTIAMVGTGFSVYTVHAEKAGTEAAQTTDSTSDSEDELSLSSMLKDNVSVSEKEIDKDETVYLISDASGNVNQTIVSDHLINRDKSDTLKDKSSLKDIENVKGDETFSQSGDDLTWQADGNDIYYQGTSTAQAPVSQKVTYYLDGKEISPEDLAGKSGKVTIHFDYTNHSTYTETVNGEEVTVCVPFAAITGMVLDDSFSNVEVTNGKVQNTGKGNIVIGYALPGLKDSLDLNDDDLDEDVDIPESFEVTADVENFSLETAMTVVANAGSFLSTDGSSDLSSVDDMIDTLTDASEQLQDGSKQLSDGLDTLQSSLKEFSSGMNTLSGGIKSYTDGAKTLGNGIGSLKNGMDSLAGSAPALIDGVNQLKTGSSQAASGAGQLVAGYEGTSEQAGLVDGAKQLADGAAQVASGVASVQDGASKLKTGSQSAVSGAGQLQSGVAKLQTGTATVKDGSSKTAAGAKTLSDSLQAQLPQLKSMINTTIASQLDATTLQLLTGTGCITDGNTVTADNIATVYANVQSNKDKIIGVIKQQIMATGIDDATATAGASQQYAALEGALGQAKTSVDNLNAMVDGVEQLVGGTAAVDAGVGQLQTGEKELKAGADALVNGLQSLDAGISSLYDGAVTLNGGAAQVREGAKTVSDGINQEYEGTKSLAAGIGQIDGGLGTVTDKMPDLTSGIKQLQDGTNQLAAGANTLVSNNDTLNSGAAQLVNGTSQIVDGVNKLDTGSHTLADGMVEFNEQGINKIVNAYKGDLKPLANRLQAMIDAGEDYQSYSDIADGANGSVKFIYKLDSIKEDQ